MDRDTLDVAGAVNIAETIFSKILDADVFVADVSLINTVPQNNAAIVDGLYPNHNTPQRPTPNPNVLLELGYAKRHLGDEAIILVANSYYGSIEQLPFDLRGLRTLTYTAKPGDAPASERAKLIRSFEAAITSIASVVRGDPVLAMIHPKTLNVAGQSEGMLRELIKAAGKQFDPRNITENELKLVCNSIDPNGQAPLIMGRDASGKDLYANWIEYLSYWRDRSRNFTTDILVFSPFLKREHVALLALVEQCSYFAQLRNLGGQPVLNANLDWLSNSIWKYVDATRKLRDYADKVLARRAAPF